MSVTLTKYKNDIKLARRAAREAAAEARQARERFRRKRRPGSAEREEAFAAAIDRLNASGKEMRSLMGKLQWPQYELDAKTEAELRDASSAVKSERRKLQKMQR